MNELHKMLFALCHGYMRALQGFDYCFYYVGDNDLCVTIHITLLFLLRGLLT